MILFLSMGSRDFYKNIKNTKILLFEKDMTKDKEAFHSYQDLKILRLKRYCP